MQACTGIYVRGGRPQKNACRPGRGEEEEEEEEPTNELVNSAINVYFYFCAHFRAWEA